MDSDEFIEQFYFPIKAKESTLTDDAISACCGILSSSYRLNKLLDV